MGDGDNATPGNRRSSDDKPTNAWLTRTPRPSRGAAPWEGGEILSPEVDTNEPGGNHANDANGVSVADLIAKVGGTNGRPTSRRHRAEPEPELGEAPVDPQSEEPTEALEPAVAWGAEAPTAVLPAVRPVPPTRIPEDSAPAEPEPKPRRDPIVVVGRLAAAVVAVLALAMTGGAWHWQSSKNNRLNTIAALDPNSRDIVDPKAQLGDENFLVVGVDSRAGANSDMGAGNTQDAGGSRSDTVILVNIPASRKRVVAISFPRDLAITPMLCDVWDSDTGKYGPVYDKRTGSHGPEQVYTETKLNSAYSFGGPKCLVKVIQKLSGLAINRFMAVDFAGFVKMVDAVGGVEVCSPTPLQDYELGTVLAKAGRQTLDARTALNYVRARQVTTEVNGDYGRIKRQQLFLSSLLRSLISRNVLFNLGKLDDVVNTFIANSYVDNVQTKDLVNLGQSMQGVAAGRITFLTVPTGVTDSEGNEPLRVDDNRALFDAIINDDPLPGENNTNATTTATAATHTPEASTSAPSATAQPTTGNTSELVNAVTTEPQAVTVHVFNSTGETGLGATAAGELQQHGFKVLTPDDYPSSLASTTVFFSPGNEQAAATVASSFTNPQIQRVSGMGDVVQVVLGPDFNNVGTPPPSGSSVRVQINHSTGSTPTNLPSDLSVTNAADTTC